MTYFKVLCRHSPGGAEQKLRYLKWLCRFFRYKLTFEASELFWTYEAKHFTLLAFRFAVTYWTELQAICTAGPQFPLGPHCKRVLS